MLVAYWIGVVLCLAFVFTIAYYLAAGVAVATWNAAGKGEQLSVEDATRVAFEGLVKPVRFALERKIALACSGVVAVAMLVLSVNVFATIGFAFASFIVVGVLTPAVQAAIRPAAREAAARAPAAAEARQDPFIAFADERNDNN